MKAKPLMILFLVLSLIFPAAAEYENDDINVITCDDGWSWDPGAYDTFTGRIDLSEYIGRDLQIRMSTDLLYDSEAEADCKPFFTVINGKRITMLKQSDSVQYRPDAELSVLSFSGRVVLPSGQHVNRITFQFLISGEDGKELKTIRMEVGAGTAESKSAFYIPIHIGSITLIIGIIAAVVWIAALFSNKRMKYKQRTGE